jgi:hypothetical protein
VDTEDGGSIYLRIFSTYVFNDTLLSRTVSKYYNVYKEAVSRRFVPTVCCSTSSGYDTVPLCIAHN